MQDAAEARAWWGGCGRGRTCRCGRAVMYIMLDFMPVQEMPFWLRSSRVSAEWCSMARLTTEKPASPIAFDAKSSLHTHRRAVRLRPHAALALTYASAQMRACSTSARKRAFLHRITQVKVAQVKSCET